MQPSSRRSTKILIALALGLVLAVVGAEAGLRRFPPRSLFLAGVEIRYERESAYDPARKLFELDEELGYLPVFGTGQYGPHGTVENSYPAEKRPSVKRLLFLGDSVTRRGKIIAALREQYGEEGYEYWNAGVEGYSTSQEVRYYERYCAALAPDRVVLTFHLNDFETTPVTFLDGEGRVVKFIASRPADELNPWLLQHSYLYRLYLGLRTEPGNTTAIETEIRAALLRLRDVLEEQGVELTVLVLPLLVPFEEWPWDYKQRRDKVLAYLAELEVEHFDLTTPMRKALREGIDVQAVPMDAFHPSKGMAEEAAKFLWHEGFLR